MRLRLFALASVPVALTGFLVGCGKKPPDKPNPDANTPAGPGQPATNPNVEVGGLLYTPVAAPAYNVAVSRRETIVIPNALAQFEERHIVSAETDGLIELIATHIKPGENVDPERVIYHPRDPEPDPAKKVKLKRLGEGDAVAAGDVLIFLDDQQIATRLRGSQEIKKAAEVARKFAAEGADAADKRYKSVYDAFMKGVGSVNDVLDAQLTLARFRENESNAIQTIAKATTEYDEGVVQLAKHRFKSRVNGIIRSIDRRPGQYVKAGEKIMEVEATDRVRIEGHLPVQYRPLLQRGMNVTVEPAVPSAPLASHTGHRQPVTGVAVTAHPDGPLVVSVAADGGLVWDPNLGKKPNRPFVPHSLPHPVGVRSVAATPLAAKSVLVVTGADDGRLRIWDLSNRDKLPTTPKAAPDEAHASAVQAIAVSPDGRHCASAAGRDVFVWDLTSVKKLYALPVEHRDNITAVSFTPQGTLVTASKDGTMKVWKLGTEKAAAVRTLDHRAGGVEVLGASRDGGRVLFDQDKGRLDLVDPATGQTVGQIENVSSASAFAALAIFGPDEVVPNTPPDQLPPYSIATVGEGDLKGTLQYWHAPRTGGRGAEVGRLITPGRTPITAAAFSPVRGEQFLAVGTSSGGVHVWKPSTEARKAHTGRITYIDPTDTRYVTVRVEMDNRQLNLPDNSAATIIITPEER